MYVYIYTLTYTRTLRSHHARAALRRRAEASAPTGPP